MQKKGKLEHEEESHDRRNYVTAQLTAHAGTPVSLTSAKTLI